MKTVLVAALVLAVTSASSFAATPLIDARQSRQSDRIYQGVVSGEISPTEYQKLMKGQTRVQRMEDRAKFSGGVSPTERARILAVQNIQSNRIFLKKH